MPCATSSASAKRHSGTAGANTIQGNGGNNRLTGNAGVAGIQAFRLTANQAVHAVWAVDSGANTLLRGDVNGDGNADFEILLLGVSSLTAQELML